MKRIFLLFFVAALFIGGITGCESTTDTNNWDLDSIVIISETNTTPPGGEIRLNAVGLTASSDTLSLDFVTWTISSEDAGSIIVDHENSQIATFRAAKEENNNIVITATELGGESATITLDVQKTQDIGCLHDGAILTDEEWTPDMNPHIVISDIIVDHPDGVTLTIDAGCEIRFREGTGIIVGYDGSGSLSAVGAEGDSIIFTVDAFGDSLEGFWNGISFSDKADNDNSVIKYAVFEYGGGNLNGEIWIHSNKCFNITDSRISFSSCCGIKAADACNYAADNVFSENIDGDVCN